MKHEFSQSRRRALKNSMLAVAGVVGLGPAIFPARGLRAQDLPQLSEDDATAKALKYTHDATASERPSDDQLCNNCMYFKGTPSDEWAGCDFFPGKAVAGKGWCSSWTAKS
jgi:hypothetical protein